MEICWPFGTARLGGRPLKSRGTAASERPTTVIGVDPARGLPVTAATGDAHRARDRLSALQEGRRQQNPAD